MQGQDPKRRWSATEDEAVRAGALEIEGRSKTAVAARRSSLGVRNPDKDDLCQEECGRSASKNRTICGTCRSRIARTGTSAVPERHVITNVVDDMGDCRICGRVRITIRKHPNWLLIECKSGRKDRILRNKYKIGLEDVEAMIAEQDGCAICHEDISDDYVIDHDHSCCSGKRSCGQCVRGALCRRCNIGLGGFRDTEEFLMSAIEYLLELG